MFIMCCHHHIVSTFLQSKIVFLDFEYVSMHFNRRNISLHYVVWAGGLQIKGWMWSELTECECGAAWAPQHSMLPESRVTWPWPGPSSPQSCILCTYLHKHLTPLTHQYQSWKCSRATPLNTAKQVGIFLSYDDGQMHRTYCILSVPVFLFWIHFQWTYLYLYRTYLYLYRNSWPRGNIQSGWCCYWPIWRRFKSCAVVIFGLCPFSMCVLFGEDFIPKNCNCTQCTSDNCYWLLSTT